MTALSLVKSGTTTYTTSTRVSQNSYRFASLVVAEFYMQGYIGNVFLDIFGLTSSSYFMNIPVSSSTIP